MRKIHEKLYSRIPSFKCKEGCMDCCGPVPFSKWEWERVQDKRKATLLSCPYAVGGRCEIYKHRPLICRLFGSVDDPLLECPHGCGPQNKLSREQGAEIMREYLLVLRRDGYDKEKRNI